MKAVACLVSDLTLEEQIKKICQDIEATTGVEYCYILERHNSVFLTEREGQTILIEMKPDDVFCNLCVRRTPVYLNDLTKDRLVINFLK